MHGVNKEVCWGVGGGPGSCGKRCGGEVRKDVWVVGRVWESVWGEWGSVLACGERMWGG